MNHVLQVTHKDEVLSLKLAFILLPVAMLLAGFAWGALFSNNITLQTPLSVAAVITAGAGSLLALGYGFRHYFEKIDRLAAKC